MDSYILKVIFVIYDTVYVLLLLYTGWLNSKHITYKWPLLYCHVKHTFVVKVTILCVMEMTGQVIENIYTSSTL